MSEIRKDAAHLARNLELLRPTAQHQSSVHDIFQTNPVQANDSQSKATILVQVSNNENNKLNTRNSLPTLISAKSNFLKSQFKRPNKNIKPPIHQTLNFTKNFIPMSC